MRNPIDYTAALKNGNNVDISMFQKQNNMVYNRNSHYNRITVTETVVSEPTVTETVVSEPTVTETVVSEPTVTETDSDNTNVLHNSSIYKLSKRMRDMGSLTRSLEELWPFDNALLTDPSFTKACYSGSREKIKAVIAERKVNPVVQSVPQQDQSKSFLEIYEKHINIPSQVLIDNMKQRADEWAKNNL